MLSLCTNLLCVCMCVHVFYTYIFQNKVLQFFSIIFTSYTASVVFILTKTHCKGIMDPDEESQALPVILRYSIINTLDDINKQFSFISKTGTRIIIYNLRRTKDSNSEFDFKNEFDIKISNDGVDSAESQYKREERQNHIPASDYSLRVSNLSICNPPVWI